MFVESIGIIYRINKWTPTVCLIDHSWVKMSDFIDLLLRRTYEIIIIIISK